MRCLRHPHGAVGGVRATCVWSRGDSARLQTERGALGYGWCLGSLWGDLVGSGMTRQADRVSGCWKAQAACQLRHLLQRWRPPVGLRP